MSLYIFSLRKGPSIKYLCNCWGMVGHPKCLQLRTGGTGCHVSCLRVHLLLVAFLSHIVLLYLEKLNLTFKKDKKKKWVRQNIFSKNLKWKHHLYTNLSCNYLLLNMAVWWGYISRRGRDCIGNGRTRMINLCLISHCWYDVEELVVPGSSNLNLNFSRTQQNVLC